MRIRTTNILQMQPVDSGVVALAIILEHFGRIEPLWRLRQASGIDCDGATAEGLAAAGAEFGLEGSSRRIGVGELAVGKSPLLIGWGRRGFVVLEGRDRVGWWINDPAHGPRHVPADEFERQFEGTVIEFRRGPGFRRGGKRPGIVASLRRVLTGCGSAVTASVIASITLVPVQLAQAGLITYFVDVLLIEHRPDRIPPFLLAAAVIYLLRAMLTFIQSQAANRLSTAASVQSKTRLLHHATRLPEPETSLRAPADVLQRLTIARQMASTLLPPLTLLPANLLTIVVFGAAVLIISPPVAAGIALAILFGLALTRLVARRLYALNVRNQIVVGMQRTTLFAGLGVRDWLLEAGGMHALFDQWLGHMANARNLSQTSGSVQLLASSGRGLVNQVVTQVGTLVLGGLGVIQGSVTIGELAALQFLAATLQTSITTVLGVLQSMPTLRSNLARIDDILDIPIPEPGGSEATTLEAGDTLDLSGIAAGDASVLRGSVPTGGLAVVRGLARNQSDLVANEIASTLRRRGRSVRVLSGRIDLHPGTIAENLSGFDPLIPTSRLAAALDAVGLGHRIRRHASGLGAMVREDQPFGDADEEARLELATVLLSPPAVVVARRGLDTLPIETASDMLARLRETGVAVVVVDPDLRIDSDAVVIDVHTPREVTS